MVPSERAQLVMSFVNTLDVEDHTDDLTSADDLARWLMDAGLLAHRARVQPSDHQLALDLRAGLREVLGVGVGTPTDPARVAAADAALRQLPVHVTTDLADPLSAPTATTARQALQTLAIAWAYLVITEQALRIKRCAEHSCGWVFWDGSKNRSGRWCSMRVCGNRSKARAYAKRQRVD